MKPHTKNYMIAFGYCKDDIILCEVCGVVAVDLHHIQPKGMGGSKIRDNVENIIALCRKCHESAHANEITKEQLTEIHNKNL